MKQDIKTGISGVYLIQCTVNGKNYIGSAKCIRKRWNTHIRDLERKKHHSIKLQEDWIKYGEENFDFKILKECSHADSKKYEMEYIEIFNSEKLGYNVKDTSETIEKRRDFMNRQILEYAKENGFEQDGNLYWFNVFKMSKTLNITVVSLLKFFGVNRADNWDILSEISEHIYGGLSFDGEDGVQVVMCDESYINDPYTEVELIKCF